SFLRSGLNQRSACHLITSISLDQAYTLCTSTSLTNLRSLKPDQFSLLGDDHYLRLVFHWKHSNDLSVLLSGLHVDDTLATTRLQPVCSYCSLLTVTQFRNRQHSFTVI